MIWFAILAIFLTGKCSKKSELSKLEQCWKGRPTWIRLKNTQQWPTVQPFLAFTCNPESKPHVNIDDSLMLSSITLSMLHFYIEHRKILWPFDASWMFQSCFQSFSSLKSTISRRVDINDSSMKQRWVVNEPTITRQKNKYKSPIGKFKRCHFNHKIRHFHIGNLEQSVLSALYIVKILKLEEKRFSRLLWKKNGSLCKYLSEWGKREHNTVFPIWRPLELRWETLTIGQALRDWSS